MTFGRTLASGLTAVVCLAGPPAPAWAQAALKAGFPGADGPYMQTLISTHRDTLGPQIVLEK